MQKNDTPITADLVLIGGGHSHLFVLRHLAMHPQPGVRITLITRDLHTPYSGMLPGYIAGHYSYDDAHIDLRPLAAFAGARLIHAEVRSIDAGSRLISMDGRPDLEYDLLSINIGSRPTAPQLDASTGLQFAVKPIDGFISGWRELEKRLANSRATLKLVVVGAGAGGVELALSLQHRSRQLPSGSGRLELALVTDQQRILVTHNRKVQRIFEDLLEQRSIKIHYGCRVDAYDGEQLLGDLGEAVTADAVIWVTQASAAGWLEESGLQLDERGFIAVDASLQSLSHENVFAAGDIASVAQYPRAKSGVFAVRQGLPLARNLVHRLQGREARVFRPQKQFLSLISSGDKFAVASRGNWALQGKWCWLAKDWIDRRFMQKFSRFETMPTQSDDAQQVDLSPMRCGGCGSKLGSALLEKVLSQISEARPAITSRLRQTEDASILDLPPSGQLIQTVDYFRSFIDDPYLFGRIACNHALGDLFAMGVQAHSAMVIATVAYASEDKQAQDLLQMMSGVVETLHQHDAELLGGHSSEGAEMSCGLSLNGFSDGKKLLLKSGMRAGEILLLTKGLGSGLLFAADMRGKARGSWIDDALQQMLQSSHAASLCLRDCAASACTDVTGFGLAGHLFEMARASDCAAEVFLDALPLYEGALQLAAQGFESSLQPQNIRIRHSFSDPDGLAGHPAYPLLFDPQTAGGLLASIPEEGSEECVQQLQALGYGSACIIGRVIEAPSSGQRLRLARS